MKQNKRTRNKNRPKIKKRELRKPIICLIQLLKCWWFAVNFCWRSSPILFRFCRLSLPWYTLVNCIVGDFNNNCCRSLKIAKRFSIANNCKKTKQIKRTWNKNRHEKKNEKHNSIEQRETKFETVCNTKISAVFKRTNFYSNR